MAMARVGRRLPQTFETLTNQWVPFILFFEIYFWSTNTKFFLKTPLTQIYSIFERERTLKNAILWPKFYKKVCLTSLFKN